MSDQGGGCPPAGRAVDALNAFLARNQVSGQGQAALNAATAEIFAAFASSHIQGLVLKGVGLARLLYRPGESRSYTDVDVLVAQGDRDRSVQLLAGLGYRNLTEPLGIDDVGGVLHEDVWVGAPQAVPSVVQVELHRWVPGAEAPPEVVWDALWRGRTSIEVDGVEVPILGREGQALQLAIHVAHHGPGYLKGIRELSLALERWPVETWRSAAELAVEIDATNAFGAGLRLVAGGARLATSLGLPGDDRLDWEVKHRDERPRGVFHLDAYRRAGLLGRVDLLRRALWPSPRWLAREYRWAHRRPLALPLAYMFHLTRAPVWAARAWWFRRRSGRHGG